jgi:hypothetical protein
MIRLSMGTDKRLELNGWIEGEWTFGQQSARSFV